MSLSDMIDNAGPRVTVNFPVSRTALVVTAWVALAITMAITTGDWGTPPAHLRDMPTAGQLY